MNIKALKQFLIDSNKAGYAGGQEKKWIKEVDGSTTIPFQKENGDLMIISLVESRMAADSSSFIKINLCG